MKAWLFQDHRQKEKLGDKAPWSVGWIDPSGKRKSQRVGAKSMAQKHARKLEGQLAAGTYDAATRKTWEQFMVEYEAKVLATMDPGTREATEIAINHFERIINPARMVGVDSRTFADYVAKRRAEPKSKRLRTSPKPGEPLPTISKATVNRELRSLRSIVRKAHRWGFLNRVPEIEFLKEDGKLPTYVAPEDFAKIYAACDFATAPDGRLCPPGDWWRGLLMFAYMTGWRIGAIMALRWRDLDLDKATALSRAADNKGRRDQLVPLHPLIVEHLAVLNLARRAERLRNPGGAADSTVFVWTADRRTLWTTFYRLQKAAGVGKAGFHDLRRAFATMNADRLTPDALQSLMQHRNYTTTQRYINMARQLNPAVANLYVPSFTPAKPSLSVG